MDAEGDLGTQEDVKVVVLEASKRRTSVSTEMLKSECEEI